METNNNSLDPFLLIIILITSIGALNWGLLGVFDFNLVSYLLGSNSLTTKVIYSIIGFFGLISLMLIGQIRLK